MANVSDIPLEDDVCVIAGRVAGKHETAKHLTALLEAFTVSAPTQPRIDTHE